MVYDHLTDATKCSENNRSQFVNNKSFKIHLSFTFGQDHKISTRKILYNQNYNWAHKMLTEILELELNETIFQMVVHQDCASRCYSGKANEAGQRDTYSSC